MLMFVPICVISEKKKQKGAVHNAHHTLPHSSLLSSRLLGCLCLKGSAYNRWSCFGGTLIFTLRMVSINTIFDAEEFVHTILASFCSYMSFINEHPGS